MERLLFDAAAALAILFAAVMVLHPHPVKSVLALVVSFFGLSVCYVLLSAPFIAAIQVIVYAGAILVLFLFVLMLSNVGQEEQLRYSHRIQRFLSGFSILVFGAMLLGLLRSHGSPGRPLASTAEIAATAEIIPLSRLLFSEYLLAFEALSILLLAALIGAFVLAHRERRSAGS